MPVQTTSSGDQQVKIVTVSWRGRSGELHAAGSVASTRWVEERPASPFLVQPCGAMARRPPAVRPALPLPQSPATTPGCSSTLLLTQTLHRALPLCLVTLQVSPTVKAVAGSIGGVVEACMLQPIDVMKTRLQLDHSGHYKGAPLGGTLARVGQAAVGGWDGAAGAARAGGTLGPQPEPQAPAERLSHTPPQA